MRLTKIKPLFASGPTTLGDLRVTGLRNRNRLLEITNSSLLAQTELNKYVACLHLRNK